MLVRWIRMCRLRCANRREYERQVRSMERAGYAAEAHRYDGIFYPRRTER